MDKEIYLKGYKEGFESALKMAWAYALDLLNEVEVEDREIVKKYIDKLNG